MQNVWMYIGYALVGVILVWSLLNAVRTGRMASEGHRFTADDNPMVFALGFAARIAMLVFCLYGIGHALGFNEDPMAALKAFLGPLA